MDYQDFTALLTHLFDFPKEVYLTTIVCVHTPPQSNLRTPNGIRTRATALKGQRPRPLDDGSLSIGYVIVIGMDSLREKITNNIRPDTLLTLVIRFNIATECQGHCPDLQTFAQEVRSNGSRPVACP